MIIKRLQKTIFPHREAKQFKDFKWSFRSLVFALKKRLEIEKDAFILVTGDTGCQPKGSKVLMANGNWKNIEDIKMGDEIISPQEDGTNKFSKVTWINNWDCPNTYDIYQSNKSNKKLYSCSNLHEIPYYRRIINRKTINGKREQISTDWKLSVKTAEEFSRLSDSSINHTAIGFSSFKIDKFKDRKNCEIDAYTLGFYLGEGYFGDSLRITTSHTEIMDRINQKHKIMGIYNKKGTNAREYSFSTKSELFSLLEKYGLRNKKSGNKFIPKEALLSDAEYRINLLAGLIESDGYYSKSGYSYCSKSRKLIEDIQNLVYSLGGRTGEIREIQKTIKSINFKGTYYEISIYLNDLKLPLTLNKKQKKTSCIYLSSNRIAIKSVKSSEKKVYGFEIDSPSHLYITDNWMVTHNSGKSHLTGNFCLKYFSKEDNFIKQVKEGEKPEKMFEKKNFIIDPGEFAVKMITEQGSVLWIDEGRDSVNRQKWFSEINQTIASRKNKNRKNFNVYFLCMPYETEIDPKLAKHLHLWIWVRRGVGEIYCKVSGKKGGTGLDIKKILDREDRWLKENPKATFVIPTIHPEFLGRIFFSKLTEGYKREYDELVEEKKAIGELSAEEKLAYGIVEKLSPEKLVNIAIDDIKKGEITNKRQLWNRLKDECELEDDKLLKILNFYLRLEGFDTFNKLFDKKKLENELDIDW